MPDKRKLLGLRRQTAEGVLRCHQHDYKTSAPTSLKNNVMAP